METRSEVNEIHSTPGNDTPDISSEDQVKSCVEETVVEMENKEDDSSENKENFIDETISNGATEKTAELAEEETAKVESLANKCLSSLLMLLQQLDSIFLHICVMYRLN